MIDPALKAVLLDLGFEEEELTEDASIRQDLELDSTETVDISLGLKRRIGVNIKLESRKDVTLAEISEQIAQAVAQSSSDENNYVKPQASNVSQTASTVQQK